VADIVTTIAITAVQAQGIPKDDIAVPDEVGV
jgi:hypothetical protein